MRLSEYRYWSPVSGEDMVRLSAFNEHGHEYFMTLPDMGGKQFRQAREHAAEAIETAITMGLAPGEVSVLQ